MTEIDPDGLGAGRHWRRRRSSPTAPPKRRRAPATAKARFEGVDMIRAERDRAVAELDALRKRHAALFRTRE